VVVPQLLVVIEEHRYRGRPHGADAAGDELVPKASVAELLEEGDPLAIESGHVIVVLPWPSHARRIARGTLSAAAYSLVAAYFAMA
jgi:hypothetical protein